MSSEYERRIIHGIPVFVQRGASKTESIDIYSWTEQPKRIGSYDPAKQRINIDEAAVTGLKPVADKWRATQIARSRAELRTGR